MRKAVKSRGTAVKSEADRKSWTLLLILRIGVTVLDRWMFVRYVRIHLIRVLKGGVKEVRLWKVVEFCINLEN